MKKQRIQLIILLLAIICAIFTLLYVKQQNKKAEEQTKQENAEIIVDEIDITNISAFSYYFNGEKISYQKEEENWICINDESLQLDNEKIQELLKNISTISATEQVVDVEELSDYGLLKPLNTITITMGDKTVTYTIGAYNDILSGSYVRKNDETTIYIVNGGITTAFTQSPLNYVKEENEEVSENSVSNVSSDQVLEASESYGSTRMLQRNQNRVREKTRK